MIKIYTENLTDETLPIMVERMLKRTVRAAVYEMYPRHKLECNITFCDNEYIHQINREQRGIDRPTDVLSFPFFDFDTPDIVCQLGDIIISLDMAHAQASEYGHSFKREICFLVLHGTLHLLGYDHIDDADREKMEAKQNEILERLGIKR